MATKEEHLGRETAEFLKPRGSIGHGEAKLLLRLSDVLAERDAAREDSEDTTQQIVDLGKQLTAAREELAKMEAERDAEHDKARALAKKLDEMNAAQPESAPVVGGVTEAMLDEIAGLVEQYPYCSGVDEKASAWLTSARAAIRAQKRVAVEAIRGVAQDLSDIHGDVFRQRDLLRAIGDEPAEAPVNSPGIQDGSIAEAPVAEPAAPAQEGPFFYACDGDDEEYSVIERIRGRWTTQHIGSFPLDEATRITAILNAGLEAEKLRARVAQLERSVAFHDGAAKEIAAERDAAEAKLAALGENPIPRGLVERHRDAHHPDNREARLAKDILAGREPGGAA